MRFWKITDEQTFKNAKEFIDNCNKLQKKNEKQLKEIVPFEWNQYMGHGKGSGFNLLVDYDGFVPKDKSITKLDGWKTDKKYNIVFIPDLRTKKGKEIKEKLKNLNKVWFKDVFTAIDLKQEDLRRFTVPYLFLSTDKKEIFLKTSDEQKVDKKRFEEVTLSYVENKID